VPVSFEGVKGLILLEVCRALDKRRLANHLGRVRGAALAQVLRTLREMFEE